MAPRRIDERIQFLLVHDFRHCRAERFAIGHLRLARVTVGATADRPALRALEASGDGRIELAGRDDFVERVHRGFLAARREVVVDVVLEPTASARALLPLDALDGDFIDDRRASGLQVVERLCRIP